MIYVIIIEKICRSGLAFLLFCETNDILWKDSPFYVNIIVFYLISHLFMIWLNFLMCLVLDKGEQFNYIKE